MIGASELLRLKHGVLKADLPALRPGRQDALPHGRRGGELPDHRQSADLHYNALSYLLLVSCLDGSSYLPTLGLPYLLLSRL